MEKAFSDIFYVPLLYTLHIGAVRHDVMFFDNSTELVKRFDIFLFKKNTFLIVQGQALEFLGMKYQAAPPRISPNAAWSKCDWHSQYDKPVQTKTSEEIEEQWVCWKP